MALPTDSEERKSIPLCTGVLDYFAAALVEVAKVSKAGNDKHNPGQPLHWSRGKSADHADCIMRHLADRGTIDPGTGVRHSAELAWRALALLQTELEAEGAAPSRGSVFPPPAEPLSRQAYPTPLELQGKQGVCDIVPEIPHTVSVRCVNARLVMG